LAVANTILENPVTELGPGVIDDLVGTPPLWLRPLCRHNGVMQAFVNG
jgi:hypothetical protein